MTWLERNGMYLSSPYRIVHATRGLECWVFSKTESGCLGREIKNVQGAKAICEAHKAKHP